MNILPADSTTPITSNYWCHRDGEKQLAYSEYSCQSQYSFPPHLPRYDIAIEEGSLMI